MNDCKEIQKKLSAFIDNELTPSEITLIEKHLHHCSGCAWEESSLRKINELLDFMPDESPAPAFVSKSVYRAASWKRGAYVKEHFYKPAIAFMRSVISLLFYPGDGSGYPINRYIRNFDDFPPESLSSIYISLIQGESK